MRYYYIIFSKMGFYWKRLIILGLFYSSFGGFLFSNYVEATIPKHLKMDEAYLNVTTCDGISTYYDTYGISTNCYKCPLLKLDPINENVTFGKAFIIDTRWPFVVKVDSIYGSCNKTYHFEEGGHYTIKADYCSTTQNLECALQINKRPNKIYIPVLIAFAILMGLAIIFMFLKSLHRSYTRSINISALYSSGRVNSDLGNPNQSGNGEASVVKTNKRLKSLDAFRGLSLTIMVFVNFGGGGYWFFEHSRWNGLTVADLVFPWFIFIMGVSLAISFRSLKQRNVRTFKIFIKIIRRTLILFSLGLLLNKGTDLNIYRIPGVLQRFAFSYFMVASLELFLPFKTENSPQNVWWYSIREILQLWKQWLVMFIILAIYLVLTYAIEVPNCGRGYTGPGGISEDGVYENCTGGMAGYIDRKFFGENHIYGHPTCKKLYHTSVAYDPEGLLGVLTSTFLTFLGLQAGKIIVVHSEHSSRERRLITWALFLGLIAIGLCRGRQNDGPIPINKNLWSLSFVLANGSMAYVLLAFCYFTIDHKKWWNGTPFIYPGMNSILVYCGHEVLHSFFPFNWQLNPVNHSKKLAMNIWGVSCWVIIAYYCYRIDFFVKI